MSEKNLGSVVGLTLKAFSRHENVVGNLDKKGRIIINAEPIVSGAKYISVSVKTDMQLYNVPVYIINSDSLVGCITLITNKVDGSAGPILRGILPTPFNYAIKADGITEVTIHENGQILN